MHVHVARAHRRHARTHFAEHLLRSEPGHVKLRNCDLLAAVRRANFLHNVPLSNRTGWTRRNQAIAAKQSRLRRPDQSNPAKQCRLRAVKAFAYKSHLSVVHRLHLSYASEVEERSARDSCDTVVSQQRHATDGTRVESTTYLSKLHDA